MFCQRYASFKCIVRLVKSLIFASLSESLYCAVLTFENPNLWTGKLLSLCKIILGIYINSKLFWVHQRYFKNRSCKIGLAKTHLSNPTPKLLTQTEWNYMHTNVFSCFICNCQKLETTQMSFKWWMDKQTLVTPCSRILRTPATNYWYLQQCWLISNALC